MYFDQEWVFCDGDVAQSLSSEGGSWLYLNDAYEIESGMTIKAGQTVFRALVT